jgi:glycogen synthase
VLVCNGFVTRSVAILWDSCHICKSSCHNRKNQAAGCAQGLLNGIDTALWDPATDPLSPAPFTPERLEGKALCKRYLQQGLGLDVTPDKPIVACITRLVPQKVSWLVHA